MLPSPAIIFLYSPSKLLLYGEGVMKELFSVPGSGYFLRVVQSPRNVVNSQGEGGAVVVLNFVSCAEASSSV